MLPDYTHTLVDGHGYKAGPYYFKTEDRQLDYRFTSVSVSVSVSLSVLGHTLS